MKSGLLGRKLGHSYSPQIHSHFGDYHYSLFKKEPEELESFLKYGDFAGINVTMPYKKDVIAYLDELTPLAKRLGAVNVVVRRNGKLIGHNTDFYGFSSMVRKSGLSPAGKKCLVLGSGGASRTAVVVLEDMGAEVVVISRNGENHYGNLHLHRDAAIIVNATPVGMYPNVGISPIDLDLFPALEGVLDAIYNPAHTQLLLDAEQRGIVNMNGLWMLVAQAKEASEWFTGTPLNDDVITKVHTALRLQMENIVLIGMPGCGKSTIGKALADHLGKTYIDTDAEIIKLARKSIPEVFAEGGEPLLREYETKVLAEFGRQSGLVIATGGGCVTQDRNYPLLHQNGKIIWLKRELTLLPTEGRPLSQSNHLAEMYAIREPLYRTFSDFVIENNASIDHVVASIVEVCL